MFAIGLVGCYVCKVNPLPKTELIDRICIQRNDAVKVSDLLPVVQQRLQYHHINSEVFSTEKPENCRYIMNYTAYRTLGCRALSLLCRFHHKSRRGDGCLCQFPSACGWRFIAHEMARYGYKINPVIDRLVGGQ
jgi:hypothetical protein